MQKRNEPISLLCTRICTFLVSCGGPYTEVNGDLQRAVLDGLASGQYTIREADEGIIFFASFYRVRPEDMEAIRQFQRPDNTTLGPYLYIVEAGSKDGAAEMMRTIRRMNFDATHMVGHRRGRLRKVRLQKGEII